MDVEAHPRKQKINDMREYALRLGIDLGSTLSQSEVAAICDIGKERLLDPGSILARQDEPANLLHLLQSGAVKTYQTHTDGRESVLRIHLTGSIIGLSSLTSSRRWDATSVAMKPCKAIAFSTKAFTGLLEHNPKLGLKLVRLLVDRLSDLHFRIGELQSQTVEQRLAYVLLSLSRPDPNQPNCPPEVAISLTHEELAQMINTRRQTVTSILTRFAHDDLLVSSNRLVRILDREGLSRRLRGNEFGLTGEVLESG